MKLLLHMCCAPCSVYPVNVLQDERIYIHGLFYNPNIHPLKEFEKRKENVQIFSKMAGIPVTFEDEFSQDKWEKFSGANDRRCEMCYSIRLERAAAFAKKEGFDAFTTTLLVSPYQKHDLINELGRKFAQKYDIEFYYRDFRPGFREGQKKAKEMGLYRQKYCGCIISYNESEYTRK